MEATIEKIQETVNSLSKSDKKWYETVITKEFWGDSEVPTSKDESVYCYVSFKKEPKNEIKKQEFWNKIKMLKEKGLIYSTWEDDQVGEIAIAVEATDEFIEYRQSLTTSSSVTKKTEHSNNPTNENLPKNKELDFYNKLIENSIKSDGNLLCNYKVVGSYNPNQIGAYITTLKEKGIVISINKKEKSVIVKEIS